MTTGAILIPGGLTERAYILIESIQSVGGLAKALGINLGSRPMAAIGDQPHEPIDRRRLIISTTSSLLILVLCLFLPAGTWAWSRGWLFLGVLLASSIC